MTGDALVQIDGTDLDRAAADLAATARLFRTEERAANRVVATAFTGWARARALSESPQLRHFAMALKPSATPREARTNISPAGGRAGALGAFWGAKRYAQFPKWVGTNWQPGVAGEGPYALNDTAAEHLDDIGDLYAAARERAFARTFREG